MPGECGRRKTWSLLLGQEEIDRQPGCSAWSKLKSTSQSSTFELKQVESADITLFTLAGTLFYPLGLGRQPICAEILLLAKGNVSVVYVIFRHIYCCFISLQSSNQYVKNIVFRLLISIPQWNIILKRKLRPSKSKCCWQKKM